MDGLEVPVGELVVALRLAVLLVVNAQVPLRVLAPAVLLDEFVLLLGPRAGARSSTCKARTDAGLDLGAPPQAWQPVGLPERIAILRVHVRTVHGDRDD